MRINRLIPSSLSLGVLCGVLMLGVGCKQAKETAEQPASAPTQPLQNDQQILSAIQAKIAAEPALNGQRIEVNVASGVATLTGTADNDASRALAAADSGSIDGVKTVINNLTVEPVKAAAKPASAPARPKERARREYVAKAHAPAAPQQAAPPPVAPPPPPPPREAVQTVAPPPPAPPPPVVKTVTLSAGAVIPVRMTDALDSATTQSDSIFHGSLATDLIVDGMVAAPRGANVVGRVVTAKDATHFSGASQLSIELTSIYAHGQQISVVTDTYTKQGAGRGKNTAMKSGGGAALGAIIGALAGGGKGAAIGAVTGGGVGAGVNGVSRGQQVRIPSETLVNFKLQSPVSVNTSVVAGGSRRVNSDQTPQLQQPQ